jgi:hypothetical protein
MDAFGGHEVTRQIADHLGVDMATFKPHEISKIVETFKDPKKLAAYKKFRSELGAFARQTLGKTRTKHNSYTDITASKYEEI